MPKEDPRESLDNSFRQSRKEFLAMVGCWIAFAIWTLGYNSMCAFDAESSADNPVLGMPRWVVFGILVPWAIALCLTVWFALRFMQDTSLDPEDFE